MTGSINANTVNTEKSASIHTSNISAIYIKEERATIYWSSDEKIYGEVQYGKTSTYGSTKDNYGAKANPMYITLRGLEKATLYHYRTITSNDKGERVVSEDKTFKTTGESAGEGESGNVGSIKVSNLAALYIKEERATIYWSSDEKIYGEVQYGKTSAYGSTKDNYGAKANPMYITLRGLEKGTLYHYRVVSRNDKGERVVSGDKTFKTTGESAGGNEGGNEGNAGNFSISNIEAKYVKKNKATIYWKTNKRLYGEVHYGLTADYGNTRDNYGLKSNPMYITLRGLEEGTVYHYKVVSYDSEGKRSESKDSTFKTDGQSTEPIEDTTAPTIHIKGSSEVSINVGEHYVDAGATATDNIDGDITSSITVESNVNVSSEGSYSVTYTVSDESGNSATATRTVIIKRPIIVTPPDNNDTHPDPDTGTQPAKSIITNITASKTSKNLIFVLHGTFRDDVAPMAYLNLDYNMHTGHNGEEVLLSETQDVCALTLHTNMGKYHVVKTRNKITLTVSLDKLRTIKHTVRVRAGGKENGGKWMNLFSKTLTISE